MLQYHGLWMLNVTYFNLLTLQVPDFQKGYGDFINRLLTFSFIPLSTIGKKMWHFCVCVCVFHELDNIIFLQGFRTS